MCAAVARQQLLPQLCVRAGRATIPIRRRVVGALTGSRVAGALGRIPVEIALASVVPAVRSYGYSHGHAGKFAAASFVDNVFIFGDSMGGSIRMLKAPQKSSNLGASVSTWAAKSA